VLNRRLLSAPRDSDAYDHLDMIRGLAAVAVLMGHALHLFFVDGANVTHFTLPLRALYFLSSFGHQAVIVFFILSGFFVGSGVVRAWQQQRWSWSAYLAARLTRLYVVLLPALILGLLWDRLGMTLGHSPTYFAELPSFGIVVSARSTVPAFLGSLFFLQEIVTPSFGSNGALWSLASEFWYYMLFPLVLTAAFGRTLKWRILTGVAAAAIGFAVGKGIALYFSIWLLGVLVALANVSIPPWLSRHRAIPLAASMLLLGAAATVARFAIHKVEYVPDLVTGLAFATFLYVLLRTAKPNLHAGYSHIARGLASCSYTTYLAHLPILCFVRSLVVGGARWQPDGYHLALWAGILAMVAVYIWGFYSLAEKHTESVRERVSARALAFAAVTRATPVEGSFAR
jgi:peptidoglycan/LPS O-acetylase OafA/YrhL